MISKIVAGIKSRIEEFDDASDIGPLHFMAVFLIILALVVLMMPLNPNPHGWQLMQ